ncbi:Dihydrofolate reductase [Penicillium hispanicum]|uniref:Dihydrofolate reductase n=1 Tax=Penicillium hispanicum TaxID=1080232 RepID=UPI002540B5ED|nr:Dihydrofolate reductase [Penicillium hispanicum]KAJ5591502.1 Dihydrofolate reductase [Penicillium hispanicum]
MPPQPTHPIPPSLPLTLIVATTPVRVASTTTPLPTKQDPNATDNATTRLGIGLKGTLPWPRIKADMSFFARATSRAPAPGTTNAIIMGRKTYDSVPPHLRPLGKRISVVITRDQSGAVREGVLRELEARKGKMAAAAAKAAVEKKDQVQEQEKSTAETKDGGESTALGGSYQSTVPAAAPITDAIVTPSLDAALAELDSVYGAEGRLGKIYVIGGAEIYGAALRMHAREGSADLQRRPVRVVMTNVVRKLEGKEGEAEATGSFECDTFFPLDGMTPQNGWRSASAREVSEWVGEEVSGEWKREGEVEVQMVGFERVN